MSRKKYTIYLYNDHLVMDDHLWIYLTDFA